MGNLVTFPGICGLTETVRVVNTDGKLIAHAGPGQVITVADVLRSHPHHYLTEAGQDRKHSRGRMLRVDEVLKPGWTYVLLPLPLLFTVGNRRSSRRPSISYCWLCISTSSFSISDSYSEDNNYERDIGPRTSLIAMEKPLGEIRDSPTKTKRSSSAPSTNMHQLLKTAEIEWKEIAELSRTWRPDLESIKEESMKALPPRQTLAELMEVPNLLASLSGREGIEHERG